MKKIIIIILITIGAILVKIPPYVELNNLAIIESIGISYNDENYTIWLKEMLPIKDQNGINYNFKYYKRSSDSIENAYKKIKSKTKKKLYLKRIKLLITNVGESEKITKELKINPPSILHTNEPIYKELKDN